MSPKDLRHYLVVYRVRAGRADIVEFAHDQYEDALDAYQSTEKEHEHEPDVEVILLSADSPDSLMATHGRFFAESRRHVDDYITERLDELLDDTERAPA